MYRNLLGTAALAGMLAFAQAPVSPSTGTRGSSNRAMVQAADKRFALDAALGGMTEVQLGQMAADKGTNPNVKEFGVRMVRDHSKAGEELKAAAESEHIDLPTALDSRHKALVERFSGLSGAEFDRAYVKEMVKEHDADVKMFQREAQNGQSPALRDFAAKTLPILEEHQKTIHDIYRKMGLK